MIENTTNDKYAELLSVCVKAAQEGGRTLLRYWGNVTAREKSKSDLVTEADLASQEKIKEVILRHFPGHLIVGEEGGLGWTSGRESHNQIVWYIDPLDGTTNFVHGVPHFSVSVAASCDGQPVVGTVFNPIRQEWYWASAGGGCWWSDKLLTEGKPQQVTVSRVDRLQDALAALGFPPAVTLDCPDVRLFLALAPRCQAIRRTGSAALNLCYVAAGRYDIAWSLSTNAWDVAAGTLLVREAGGQVMDETGQPLVLPNGHFFAASCPRLMEQLLQVAKQAGVLRPS